MPSRWLNIGARHVVPLYIERRDMKKKILLIILIFGFCYPLTGHSQWKMFEHRAEYKHGDVLQASKFVDKKGYWEGYIDDELAGYVFISKDWTEKLIGYSGKHMETLIGMDANGIITGVKVLFHSEPIVLIGLKEKNYLDFLDQYPGKDMRQDLTVGKGISMDAITGATVTAVVQNAIILRSARKVASQTGLIEYVKGTKRRISEKFAELSWNELLSSEAIKNIRVTTKELGIEGKDLYIDLYFGIVTVPSVGRNVLGDKLFKETINRLNKGESAIFIASKGKGSFKGSGFARGGIFERFSIEQQDRGYAFKDSDYNILTDIKAEDAPSIKEGGLFIVRGKDFESSNPFKFNLVIPYRIGGKKEFKSFSVEYQIPDRFLEK
jgi:NosR/NirI family nitrous oxide reductase transcriptional regulator